MIIIAGHLRINESQRDAFVQAHQDLIKRARGFDGCVELAITADSLDPGRVNNLEIWRDTAALDAWRRQADPPSLDTSFDDTAMKRYDAEDGGPLFQ